MRRIATLASITRILDSYAFVAPHYPLTAPPEFFDLYRGTGTFDSHGPDFPAGLRRSVFANLVDIYPTALQALGVSTAAGKDGEHAGLSLS